MKILSVVGARPQFIKLFPISKSIPDGVTHEIIHTGQHYDESMSQIFFDQLSIPRPYRNLNIGSGSHATQTAAMMIGLEESFIEKRPDVVLVYGDTNSTLAASLSASKLNIPIAHLEAGLRSFNRRMPEEQNRIVTDHLSQVLLAPTQTAISNLRNEGLAEKSIFVGDVMVDAIKLAQEIKVEISFDIPQKYILATIHRAENTDSKVRIIEILNRLEDSVCPIVMILHPRFIERCDFFGIELNHFNLKYLNPQPYLHNLALIRNSLGVITDSGGIQKEAYLLGLNTLTVRNETEWVETFTGNCNVLDYRLSLVTSDWYKKDSIFDPSIFGDGNAAKRTVTAILEEKNYFS
jgi:UDP-N-acetylglucosamine 2-epimerase